jgi:hypothetical protein
MPALVVGIRASVFVARMSALARYPGTVHIAPSVPDVAPLIRATKKGVDGRDSRAITVAGVPILR